MDLVSYVFWSQEFAPNVSNSILNPQYNAAVFTRLGPFINYVRIILAILDSPYPRVRVHKIFQIPPAYSYVRFHFVFQYRYNKMLLEMDQLH